MRKMYMINGTTADHGRNSAAFTCLELLACVTVIALLMAVMLPALANSSSRADRVACFSNMRQIGNAFIQFGLEHNDLPPWRLGPSEGGNNASLTSPSKAAEPPDPAIPGIEQLKHNLWFQYWWLRDLIKTPTVLMDPAETRQSAQVATSWDSSTNGIWRLGNNAVAYMLGYDAFFAHPQSILLTDRNVIDSGIAGGPLGQLVRLQTNVRWFNDIHGIVGNVTFADGRTETLNTEQFRAAVGEADPLHAVRMWKASW